MTRKPYRPVVALCSFVMVLSASMAAAAQSLAPDPIPTSTPERFGSVANPMRFAILEFSELQHELDAGGIVSLPLTAASWRFEVTENAVIPEPARWVERVNSIGGVERTGEYVTARTFDGEALEHDGRIALTVDIPNRLVFAVIWATVDEKVRVIDIATVPMAQVDDTILLEISWQDSAVPPLPGDAVSLQSHEGTQYMAVGAFGDGGYRWHYGTGWTTRIANAINAQVSMWRSQTSIEIFVGGFRESPNQNGECSGYDSNDYMLLRFANWLEQTGQADDFPVKQLWTDDELRGCIGEGYNQQSFWGKWAVSVLEGSDWFGFDGYNPTYASQSGSVSAEEIAHNHFAGGHPCTTNAAGQPNVVSSCHDVDDRIFWFESTYVSGVHQYGYSQL